MRQIFYRGTIKAPMFLQTSIQKRTGLSLIIKTPNSSSERFPAFITYAARYAMYELRERYPIIFLILKKRITISQPIIMIHIDRKFIVRRTRRRKLKFGRSSKKISFLLDYRNDVTQKYSLVRSRTITDK